MVPRDHNKNLCLILTGIVLVVSGCGERKPPAYPAQGRVAFANGSPIHTGTIELKSREHGIHARGVIQPDGTFVLSTYSKDDGAVAGTHDCVVVQLVLAEELQGRSHGKLGVVHPKFASYATSGLTCEVEPKLDNTLSMTVEGIGKFVEGGTEKDHKK